MKTRCIVCGTVYDDTDKTSEFYIGKYGSEKLDRYSGIEFDAAYFMCPKHGLMVKNYIESLITYNKQIREL